MQTLNLHAHTTRCNHAVGTDREYIEHAIAGGIKTLGISDHAPMPFTDGHYSFWRMHPEELQGYVDSLLSLREEFKNDIRLLIGLEVEYYPSVFRNFLKLICDYPVDYLLLGQHIVGEECSGLGSTEGSSEERDLIHYVDQSIEALDTGVFTYCAHPDVFNFRGSDEIYRRHMLRLCNYAKEHDIPLEINLLGLWDNRFYPSDRFFRIAGEVGNTIVIGTDAHDPTRFDDPVPYQKALEMAKRCGLTVTEDIPIIKPHTI